MTNDHYVILGRDNCQWCEKAIDLLTYREKTYHYMDIKKHEALRAFMIQNGLNTVPQIYLDGELIGGYSDLEHYLEDW